LKDPFNIRHLKNSFFFFINKEKSLDMNFVGTWEFKSSENFDEYLKALGIGMIKRKIGASLKPTCVISKDGNTWILKMDSSVANIETRFVEGVEFDEGINLKFLRV
jgi:hypothetical protein